MNDSMRKQIYNNLSLRETEDLLEIWQTRSDDEWDPAVFEIIEAILIERLGALPPPAVERQALSVLDDVEGYLQSGKLDKALLECERVIQQTPGLAAAYNLRGVVYDELGQPENAIENYRTAIQLDPKLEEAWENLLIAEQELEDDFQHSAARRLLDLALDHACNDEPEKALEACERAKEELPRIPAAYNYLGAVLEISGHLESAIEVYRTAIQLNSRANTARENLGNALVSWEAEQYRRAASESQEGTPEADAAGEEDGEAEIEESWEFADPIPGWIYLDEKAFLLIGWAGYRNRPGRSGYDPLETYFEYAHMLGVIIRRLATGKFTPRTPLYLLLMTCIGLIYSVPYWIGVIGLFANVWGALVFLVIFSPYWVIGLALLVNVVLSLWLASRDDFIDERVY